MASSPIRVQVSVRMKRSLLEHMKEIWTAKYGGKGRSRWVDEVVREYLLNKDYFYQQSNFLDLSDYYAYQFVFEIKNEGALTKVDEETGINISDKVKSQNTFDDPITNEKFALSQGSVALLKEAERNVNLMKSRLKTKDPRGCIIRTAIEYGIVHSHQGIQQTIDL